MAKTELDSLTLRSTFDEVERLEPFLDNLQDVLNFSDEQFPKIRLALNEAVTNAIVHGNKQDESKKVDIVAYRKDGELIISVKDEGPGFDPSSLPNPLKEENLLKESGRGIFLIKEQADEVQFEDNATKLIMHFIIK